MKKFWIVLLAVGLCLAFTMPAAAQTSVTFSGSYIVNGIYADNPSLRKQDAVGASDGRSAYAVYDQRLRVNTVFKVAEGLSLVTRFDALEKVWGDRTWGGAAPTNFEANNRLQWGGGNLTRIQENLEFERAFVDFTTPIGRFNVGYQGFTTFGTAMADGANTKAGIKYLYASGPLTVIAAIERNQEGQRANMAAQLNAVDVDSDAYDLGFIYKFAGGDVGVMYQYVLGSTNRTLAATPFSTKIHIFNPYVRYTTGPVYVEAEGVWLTGKFAEFEQGTVVPKPADIDADGLGLYVKVNVDLKPAYVGAIFVWSQGDDYGSATKVKGGWLRALAAGSVFEPCLIFGSFWYTHAAGASAVGYAPNTAGTGGSINSYSYFFDNIWFGQLYAGYKPSPKLDVFASISTMKVDQKPRLNKGVAVGPANPEFVSDSLGTELDVKVSYKIFDNLTYTVGGAYFWTGDYFKGTNSANEIANNYLLMHQLMLSF